MRSERTTSLKHRSKQHRAVEYFSFAGLKTHMAPTGLHLYGVNYLEAAKIVPMVNDRFAPARYLLICHSIELLLKAFLSINGRSLEELAAKFGHDLWRLLLVANEHGLTSLVTLEPYQLDQIELASEYYAENVFEYPAIEESLRAYPRTPQIKPLIEAAELLAAALEKPCLAC